MNYNQFLTKKAIIDAPTGIPNVSGVSEALFPFQRTCVEWALRRGRAALFEGTGLGKTPQQCEWAKHVANYTGAPVLIVAPLAVSHQTIAEAKNILGMDIRFAETGDDIEEGPNVYITNYQKLDHFDPSVFGGVALDESSIIKNIDGKTKSKLLDMFQNTRFRLACTATPAPNDFMELGNHAEFLGVMSSAEMLSTFFVHDGGDTSKWRLKGHAEQDFWRWLASWSICIQSPADLGFDGSAYVLPELRMHEIIVDVEDTPLEGELFAMPARTLQERRQARKQSTPERVAKAAEIASSLNGDQLCVWSNLNDESESIAKAIGAVEIAGRHDDDYKSRNMLAFARGEIKRLSTKPSICGFGMNWQNCHKVIYLGLSDSWEQLYQSIRRFWRFGQKNPVDVYIVISSQEGEVLKNIKRKERDAQRMMDELSAHMADFTKREIKSITRTKTNYQPTQKWQKPKFL